MSSPKVSVIMAVHNAESTVGKAIDSILGQSFADFEFLIVDDGSDDGTAAVLTEYAAKDQRIKVITNEQNIYLAAALNKAINQAEGEYLLRMDADDESLPNRIKLQVEFMDANPDIVISGTAINSISPKHSRVHVHPSDPEELYALLLFHSVIFHPTAIMRRRFMLENDLTYDERLRYAQDYELWVRASEYGKLGNLPQPLLNYQVPLEKNVEKKTEQQQVVTLMQRLMLERLGISASEAELKLHQISANPLPAIQHRSTLEELDAWFLRLKKANDQAQTFEPEALRKVLLKKFSAKLNTVKLRKREKLDFLSTTRSIPLRSKLEFAVKLISSNKIKV